AAQLIDAWKLLGEFVTNGHQLVVQLVVLHPRQNLMIAVKTADIAVMGLPPQTGAELLLYQFGTAVTDEQLHSAPSIGIPASPTRNDSRLWRIVRTWSFRSLTHRRLTGAVSERPKVTVL